MWEDNKESARSGSKCLTVSTPFFLLLTAVVSTKHSERIQQRIDFLRLWKTLNKSGTIVFLKTYLCFCSSTKLTFWLKRLPGDVISQNSQRCTHTFFQISRHSVHQVSIYTSLCYLVVKNYEITFLTLSQIAFTYVFSSLYFSESEVLQFLQSYPEYNTVSKNSVHPDTVKTAVYIKSLFMVGFVLYHLLNYNYTIQ